MSTVVLHRDPIPAGWHVTRLPAWIAPRSSRPGRYWHQPRSAFLHDGRLIVDFWCGQMAPDVSRVRLRGVPPESLKCGTCIGRRMGYDRTDGTIFTPRDHWALPARCPGVTWEPPDHKLCLACGDRVQAARGWNSWGSAQHRPGPALAERLRACPRHGWRHIHQRDERFSCTFWQCEWVS